MPKLSMIWRAHGSDAATGVQLMKRARSAGLASDSTIRSSAALRYSSYCAGVMPSALAVLSKLNPSSARNVDAG
jgi:hypothetical protein